MTELQRLFLLGVFVYYVFKGSMYVVLYVALIVVEKNARMRHAQIREMLKGKRADEKERWKVAYSLLERQEEMPIPSTSSPEPVGLSQLVNNPNSFTAYSSVKPCF